MEISLYMKNELTDVIQPALLLQKLKMESLPNVVFDPPLPPLLLVSFVRATSRVEKKEVLGVDAEWETADSGGGKWWPSMHPPQHGMPFLFHLQRAPSGFTKEMFPTALEGRLL